MIISMALLDATGLFGFSATAVTMALGFFVVLSVLAFIALKILAKTVKAAVRMFVFLTLLAIAVIGAGVLMIKHSGPDEAPAKKPTANKKRR
jgi:uncharacterized membrane protein